MNEKDFEELIKRYQAGQASEKEKSLLESWFHQRMSSNVFDQLSEVEKEEIRNRTYEFLSAKLKQDTHAVGRSRYASATTYISSAAAVIIVLAMFSYSLLRMSSSREDINIRAIHSITSHGGTKKVILGDSSIVWLKDNSSVSYPEEFEANERHVKLTGEALFEVAKDPARPFIIECGDLVTKVLGTSFNIKSGETSTEVMVLTGTVSISSKQGSQRLTILPNEKAVYYHLKKTIEKVGARKAEIAATTARTEYSMRFNATRLEDVIQRIEGKFDVRVTLSDPGLNNCTITADFTDQSLHSTLSMIAQSLKLKYEIDEGVAKLKGKACVAL